jgi:AhpD family alkylhydroperoxidase
MTQRIDLMKIPAPATKAMFGLQAAVDHSGLEPEILELVKMRASQINGCAYCIDMHYKDAKTMGETDERLYMLNAWRESPLYSSRERAALAWCETLTLVADRGAPDDVFDEVHSHFDDEEIAYLTLAIVAINGWNRINIGFRTEPGNYQPSDKVKRAAREKAALV